MPAVVSISMTLPSLDRIVPLKVLPDWVSTVSCPRAAGTASSSRADMTRGRRMRRMARSGGDRAPGYPERAVNLAITPPCVTRPHLHQLGDDPARAGVLG